MVELGKPLSKRKNELRLLKMLSSLAILADSTSHGYLAASAKATIV